MGISINIVIALKHLACLTDDSSNQSKPVRSSLSVHSIKGNYMVLAHTSHLDVDEEGCVIQIRVD